MKLTTKQLGILAAIIFVILIAVGYWFYRKGKKTVTIQDVPVDNPTPTGPNNSYGVSASEISSISDSLFRDMDAVLSLRDNEPYKKLIQLSDTDTVKVYNHFNDKHQTDSGETLKQWISGEFGIGEFSTLKESILEKMDRLNLI